MKNTTCLVLGLTALSLATIGCDQVQPITDPIPYSVDAFIEQPGLDDDLQARAVRASGIVSDLERGDYPLTLFLTDETELKVYLEAEGMTEEEFLAHPKLPEFYKSQLVNEDVGMNALKYGAIGDSKTVKSVSGAEITITKVKDDADTPAARNGEINGVPSYMGCYVDEGINPGDAKGFVCYADGPVVKDFNWAD